MEINKQTLANAFREISILETNFYKSRVYLASANILENMPVEEFSSRRSFLNIPGIGMSINTKILEFKEKGTLPPKLYKLREENKSYLDPQLYKIRKGFITKRIPFEDAVHLCDSVLDAITKNTSVQIDKIYFLGSFRRHKSLIADLDVLIVGEENYIEVTEALNKSTRVNQVVGGPMKTTYVFDNPEKTTMDITWCTEEQLPFSILHFTGSSASNIRLRAKAKKMGYILNQYGIYPSTDNTKINFEFKSEEDIFKFLDEPYVDPKNR